MPGGRPIMGCDVIALAGRLAPEVDRAALAARIDPAREYADLDELADALGPSLPGLPPGRLAALLGPLFGEFE